MDEANSIVVCDHVTGANRTTPGDHVTAVTHENNRITSNHQEDGATRNDVELNQIPSTQSPKLRLLKTFCMWMVYFGLGSCVGVAYATVEDMTDSYHASYDDVTTAQMMKAIGLMTGFIFGTPITDRFRKIADLFLFIFGVLFGLTLCAIPWPPNLVYVGVLFYLNGLCHSTLDICCVTICIAMWGKKASAPVVGLYTCLAVGQTVSPLITAPFLSEPIDHNSTNASLDDYGGYSMYNEYGVYSSKQNMTSTRMKIPYAIFGGWSIFIAFIFLIFHLFTPGYQSTDVAERKSIKTMLNPATCANGSAIYGVYFVVCLFFAYFFVNGRDRGFGMFVFTVANKRIGVTKSTAAVILFSYNAVGTLARALCAFLSIYIPVQIIVTTLVIGAVFVQIFVVFFSLHSEVSFWVLTCLMSTFITPIYPFLMPWADRYIEVNGLVMGIINIGVGCGGISCMFLTSYVFQHYSSQAVVLLALVYGAGLALVFVPLQVISHIRGARRVAGSHIESSKEPLISDAEERAAENIASSSSTERLIQNAEQIN